jgi:hypothetical protein
MIPSRSWVIVEQRDSEFGPVIHSVLEVFSRSLSGHPGFLRVAPVER